MNKSICIAITFLLFGCSDKIRKENLDVLNGYWEIEKVVFPDGSTKEYAVNTSIDFISLEDKKGYRKKMQPKFNGTYDTSNDADLFILLEREGIYFINYEVNDNTGLETHRLEELVSLSENKFSVRNADGITYDYKRFEPINIEN